MSNKNLIKDSYPLHRIDDQIDRFVLMPGLQSRLDKGLSPDGFGY